MPALADESLNLIFTSPLYALNFKKDYGNADQDKYGDWFPGFAPEFKHVLEPDGSLRTPVPVRPCGTLME